MSLVIIPPLPERRGRHSIYGRASTSSERSKKRRAHVAEARAEKIAILDMETDPFDAVAKEKIEPFLAVLYGDDFETVVIWDEDIDSFIARVIAAIEALPVEDGIGYTVYAHNGGKFDFMFIAHKLRGKVSFKGRGIMLAKIGAHELRDSFHIIPEKLASLQKDAFDYKKMHRANRHKWKEEIIRYCISDCKYLLGYVKTFVAEHGLKLSIGQAALTLLKKSYKVKQLSNGSDAYLRNFFFGGRVECLAGQGHFAGDYKLYDVNSMYPYVMANYQHPIGNQYNVRRGEPNSDTVFVDLTCKNYGAFVRRGDAGETNASFNNGRFLVSIWEYETALRLNLITHAAVSYCIDCVERSDFSLFILPLYLEREKCKRWLKENANLLGTAEYNEVHKRSIFLKLLMNNAYGKFAQNPRRFKETYITEPDERPPQQEQGYGDLPNFRNEHYALWERPAPLQYFNNVGTAASITGAARSVLLEAIFNSVDPIYCDTDSLICRELRNVHMHGSELGAWDLEQEFSEVMIAGKKLYAGRPKVGSNGQTAPDKVRSKGAAGLTWEDVAKLLRGEIILNVNPGVTMTKRGDQYYMERLIRATAPLAPSAIREHLDARSFSY